MSYFDTINAYLKNVAGTIINPATEEKQDDSIVQLTTIAGDTTSLDGKVTACDTTDKSTATLQTAANALITAANALLATIDADTGSILTNQTNGAHKTQLTDSSGNAVSLYAKPSGGYAMDIHDADVHNKLINRNIIDFDSATENPSSAISSGDITILVASTTGFSVGDVIVIKDASGNLRELHFHITAITVDTSITVDRPIDLDYTTSATIELVALNMNVSGSLASPVIYECGPPSDEVWHITRLFVILTDQTAMDDALFGGITALINGVTIIDGSDGLTLTNWKSNASIKEDMYDVEYSPKAPAGYYGLVGRWTFKNAGVSLRLDGAAGDKVYVYIQDDLTGLDTLQVKIQGHIEGA